MPKSVFYSFHFDNDVFRVQQVRNMGALDGNPPVTANEWESIKRKGAAAVQNWIQDNMAYKKCAIVLIGTQTHERPWVQYEIKKAWNDGRGVLGVYIHNLNCPKNGKCRQGINPFSQFKIGTTNMSYIVPCYDPTPTDAYNSIKSNIDLWVDDAIRIRGLYSGTAS
ncbi:TIR domain-containing protein [Dyadobacter endophyticus]|uniref:TIR domain-containing protein n=1 Tax=Dyadobacter endophyticus TaxID=1749036 RepID=UPI003CF2487C